MNKIRTNHGGSGTRLYSIYCTMLTRCYNKNNHKYKSYGAKGILVCGEWLNNFISFRQWALENGYKNHLQLDRVKNEEGYSPNNCRWSTEKEQQRNRTNNVYLTAFGETKLRKEWLEDKRCIVTQDTLRRRLKLGWLVEQALTHPKIINQFSMRQKEIVTHITCDN